MTKKVAPRPMSLGSFFSQNASAPLKARVAPPVLKEVDAALMLRGRQDVAPHSAALQRPQSRQPSTAHEKVAQQAKSILQGHLMASIGAKIDLTPAEAARLNNTIKPMAHADLKTRLAMLENLQRIVCDFTQGDAIINALTPVERANALNTLLSIPVDELDDRVAGLESILDAFKNNAQEGEDDAANLGLSLGQQAHLALQALKAPAEDMFGLGGDVREMMCLSLIHI